jgi:hypothetical protein
VRGWPGPGDLEDPAGLDIAGHGLIWMALSSRAAGERATAGDQ